MSKKVEIVLDSGEVLDLANEFGMGVNYSVEDITDPSKRNSSFTKTIILPGTKNNNKILGYLFDVNTDFTYFNPNFKTDCKIVVDGTVILDGFLQLRKIDKQASGDLIYYETVVYQEAVDFFSLMGEDFLTNLDYSELDHSYNGTNIGNSWDNTYEDGYVYPMYYKNSKTYQTQDFLPAIFLRYYLEKIALDKGFTLGGSFLDDPIFNKEIIPYNSGQPEIDDGIVDTRTFNAGASTSILAGSATLSGLWPSRWVRNLQQLDTEIDPNDIWWTGGTTDNKWTVNANGKYSLGVDIGYKHIIGGPANTWLRQDSTNSGDSPIPFWLELQAYKNGVAFGTPLVSNQEGLPYNVSLTNNQFNRRAAFGVLETGREFGTEWTYYFDIQGDLFKDEVLNINDEITFKTIFRKDPESIVRYAFDGSDQYGGYAKTTPATVDIVNILYVESSLDSNGKPTKIENRVDRGFLADYDEIEMDRFIPLKVKQKDLFSDLIRRYNLMVTTDPLNNKKILLETRDEFYSQSGVTTLDWTEKKDWSYNDQIELLSELQAKKINFKYKQGNDKFSSNFESITGGLLYGEKEIEYTNEFVKGEKDIESIYSSTPLIYNLTNTTEASMIVPFIDTKVPKTNIKVLQYNGLKNCLDGKTWSYQGVSAAGNPIGATHTTYPFAGHWDDPLNPSFDNHFSTVITLNGEEKAYEYYNPLDHTATTGGASFTGVYNNLYNRYWSSYINQIDDGKLVTMRLNLSETDISDVKDNFETIIYIDDAYYYINLIQDYDPTKDGGLTIVKLLKMNAVTVYSPQTAVYTGTTGTVQVEEVPVGLIINPSTDEKNGRLTTVLDSKSNIQTQHAVVVGADNIVYGDTTNVSIIGEDNIIENGVTNSGILGSTGSLIESNVKNSYIIGVNGKTITRDNEIWLGNMHLIDGVIVSEWNLIEGGLNQLGWPQLYGKNQFTLIEGGDDEIRDPNWSNIQNLIDGGLTESADVDEAVAAIPSDLAGLTVWLDPSDSSNYTLDGSGNYTTVSDKSGLGNDFTQGTSGNRATPGTENGLTYMDFDGSSDRYFSTQNIDFSNTDKLTIFFAGQHNDNTSSIIYEHSSNYNSVTDGFIFNIDGSIQFGGGLKGDNGYNGKKMSAADTLPIDTNELYMITYDKSEVLNEIVNVYKNGVIQSVTHPTVVDNTNNFGSQLGYIGARGNTTTAIADIKLYEFMIFDRVLTDAEIDIMNEYLNTKWNLY